MHLKILCVCQGGNCRSAALAFLLKYRYGQNALAAGWEGNGREGPETLAMLCKWADLVIVLESHFVEKLPPEAEGKTSVYDVGPDRWYPTPYNEDLMGMLDGMIQQQFRTVEPEPA